MPGHAASILSQGRVGRISGASLLSQGWIYQGWQGLLEGIREIVCLYSPITKFVDLVSRL